MRKITAIPPTVIATLWLTDGIKRQITVIIAKIINTNVMMSSYLLPFFMLFI